MTRRWMTGVDLPIHLFVAPPRWRPIVALVTCPSLHMQHLSVWDRGGTMERDKRSRETLEFGSHGALFEKAWILGTLAVTK
jgi:hypothetical protein